MLDSEELLHLAIDAAKKGDHHSALSYLHSCIDKEPGNARARFLLGAEYAELRLFDRAIVEYKTSLDMDPSLELAEIQLALLYMVMGSRDLAAAALQKIIQEQDGMVFGDFAKALLLVLEGDQVRARDEIRKISILLEDSSPLKLIVQNVLDALAEAEPGSSASAAESLDARGYTSAQRTYSTSSFGEDE